MDLKAVKSQIFHQSVARRVFFRVFLFASAISIIPIVHILTNSNLKKLQLPTSHGCLSNLDHANDQPPKGSYLFQGHFLNPVWDSFESVHCKENVNLTVTVVRELMSKNLLNSSAKTLCVGEGSSSAVLGLKYLGFSHTIGISKRPFLSFKRKHVVYELSFADGVFDFVYSRNSDAVSFPVPLVLELERVVKAGGVGALVLNSLNGSVNPVSSLLRSSRVVHMDFNQINNFKLVVFMKNV